MQGFDMGEGEFPEAPEPPELHPKYGSDGNLITLKELMEVGGETEAELKEYCLNAVKQEGYMYFILVPEVLKTAETCLVAVKDDGLALEHVPEEFKTMEICLIAVKGNGNSLGFVPEKFKTLEICLAAVKKDKSAIVYVPRKFKSEVSKQI